MTTDDDQTWLDLLAGRAVPRADPQLAREAAALRDGMQRYRLAAPPAGVPAGDERLQRLLARARAAGVLPAPDADVDPRPAASPTPKTAPRPPARGAALTQPRRWPAVVLGLGLALGGMAWWGLQPAPSSSPPPYVLRGDGVLQRMSADAAAARTQRDALLRRLRALGFEADAYEQLGRPGIDLVLAQPLTAAQQAALVDLGIAPGTGPQLRIEFAPRQP